MKQFRSVRMSHFSSCFLTSSQDCFLNKRIAFQLITQLKTSGASNYFLHLKEKKEIFLFLNDSKDRINFKCPNSWFSVFLLKKKKRIQKQLTHWVEKRNCHVTVSVNVTNVLCFVMTHTLIILAVDWLVHLLHVQNVGSVDK